MPAGTIRSLYVTFIELYKHPNQFFGSHIDRVSVPSPIAIDMLMVRNGEGQSSHVPVFCVNFERHICTHITTSIKCYLHSLRYVYVPFTNILCQSNWHVYI